MVRIRGHLSQTAASSMGTDPEQIVVTSPALNPRGSALRSGGSRLNPEGTVTAHSWWIGSGRNVATLDVDLLPPAWSVGRRT